MVSFLEKAISVSNNILWSYILIALLIGLGVYFTFKTKFVQFRLMGEMFRLLGDGVGASAKDQKAVSSFGAFCISTASRVGTGNLAGVAIAIATGGPGAVFWMWLIALIGSATAFVEATLAQIYKVKDKQGYRGGPAYYMEKALGQRWMGVLFAILITLCFGLVFNSVQANTITLAFKNAYGLDRLVVGLIITLITAFIIFGGVKRIAKVSELMVPVMAGGYIILALFIIVKNFSALPAVFSTIFSSAFGLKEVVGGGVGAAIMMGIKRGLFSNEAGMGSAPNAAATAQVSHPVKQGLIQALGVFVDTLMVCSATAFIVLLSDAYVPGGSLTGIELVQAALSSHIGDWAKSFVAIVVFLFAFSSIVGNYYYGETNIEFIKTSKTWLLVYRLAVVGMVLFGSVAKIAIVWDMADLFMALMAITNLIAIALLGKIAKDALEDYLAQKKKGQDPVFHVSHIPGLKNVECWGEPAGHNYKGGFGKSQSSIA
ncbi:amino acid carrier protein [Desulfotomaculum nigrificans CO-1-SRB]|uniref:Amino acid carrier protein n=1 Tax=Desulfotomaculum nigrificans (strain DSM 14880 / VKM B-2319 / CO-1-SRB) TaxID=868595 RepID=F6B683_DESCC|nr:alanine/glycine:cation symporter family protein [Desulfotomaculum nigrificans]AEF95506.1 amino acid carrier protein [Desulfotomaculum nigrificans CO-1-SRB]